MNFRQLIIRNLRGNFRTYAAYFVSSAFAAMVFYIFSLLLFHPQLEENLSNSDTLSSLAKVGLSVALVVIALLSLLFLWYTFVVFLKRRKRDLAIYLILGIEEKDLRKILFVENALLGTCATVIRYWVGDFSDEIVAADCAKCHVSNRRTEIYGSYGRFRIDLWDLCLYFPLDLLFQYSDLARRTDHLIDQGK